MPIVDLKVLEGVPDERLASIVEQVTDVLERELNQPRKNIRVLICEIPRSRWAVAGHFVEDPHLRGPSGDPHPHSPGEHS